MIDPKKSDDKSVKNNFLIPKSYDRCSWVKLTALQRSNVAKAWST